MDNKEKIKKENKKAFPQFVLIFLIGALLGGLISFLSSSADGGIADSIKNSILGFLCLTGPYMSFAAIILLLLPSYIVYRKCRASFNSWDGDDEKLPEEIEHKLNVILLLIQICCIIYFLSISCIITLNCGMSGTITGLVGFLLAFALSMLMQQKAVDLTRCLNSEKQGSIYDMRFQKKWYNSCDEAEKKLIGEASYRAFTVTQNTTIILFVVAILAHVLFNTGIFPFILILIILSVSQLSYIVCAMKISRGRK